MTHSAEPLALVVEDDRRLAAFLDRGLAGAGYRVDLALDGLMALDRAEAHWPDVVVLDLMLPGV